MTHIRIRTLKFSGFRVKSHLCLSRETFFRKCVLKKKKGHVIYLGLIILWIITWCNINWLSCLWLQGSSDFNVHQTSRGT